MGDMMSITDMLARLRADAADERFEGARLGPTAVRELLRHVDALRRERDELARQNADLAAMVKSLIRRERAARERTGTGAGDDPVEEQCLAYLREKGLMTPLFARPALAQRVIAADELALAAAPERAGPRFAPCGRSAGTCGRSTRGCGRRGCQADTSEPVQAEPQPRLICSSNGLLGATSGVGRECGMWIEGVCTSPDPCQHQQQSKPCRCRRCMTERGDGAVRMILCPTCGNKRCPHATDHRHACTGSNEPGQPGSWYGGMPEQTEPTTPCRCGPDGCPKGER